jgi:hypothetical protein
VDDAGPAADGAILDIGLIIPTAEIDIELLCLAAEGTHDLGAFGFVFHRERRNSTKSASSSTESSSGFP